MNRSRVLVPAAAGVVLLGVGVYFSGGGLEGDASGAGCGGGEVVDVQQDVGTSDAELDSLVADLSNWAPEALADPTKRPEFDRQLADVVSAGADAIPSLTSAIQAQGCNEATSEPLIGALHEIIVDKSAVLEGVQGIATVLVSAAAAGLTEYDLAGDEAPSFSDYGGFDALAQEVLEGTNVPAVRAWLDDASSWTDMAADDAQTRCSLRALDTAVALNDASALDRLLASLRDEVPAGHPAARHLVEAALDLAHTQTDSAEAFRGIALDRELHPDARGLACWGSAFDKDSEASAVPLRELTSGDVAPMFATCSLLTTAPDLGLELAQQVESSNSAVVRLAAARRLAVNLRAAELEQFIQRLIDPPAVGAGVCDLDGVVCGYADTVATSDAIVGQIGEDEEAAAELRSRLEAAVVDASPSQLGRLTVLARAADDLWATPIPGLEY